MSAENLPPFPGTEDTGEGRTLAERACSIRRVGDFCDHLFEAAVQSCIPSLRPVPRHTSGFKPAPDPLTRHSQEFEAIPQPSRHFAMQREAAFFRKLMRHWARTSRQLYRPYFGSRMPQPSSVLWGPLLAGSSQSGHAR